MAKTAKKSTKPAPKKASAKPVAKKVAPKPAAKKAAAKPIAKKVAAKPAAKKVVAKPAPKKIVAKAAPKPIVKKVVVKSAPKKVTVKAAPKKASAKPVAKKVAPKPTPKKAAVKPAAKKVAVQAAPKKVAAKKAAFNPKGGKLTDLSPKDISKKAISKSGKKAVVKPTPKKVVSKPASKNAAVKPVAKNVTVKPAPKKAVVKAAPKPVVKKVATKSKSALPKVALKEDKTAKIALRKKKIQEIKNNYESPKDNQDENYGDYKAPIIGRTRFSDAELNEFKAVINKKLAEAREELNFYQDQMKESEMNDDDIKFSGMEDGGHTNDKEHLSAMANRQVKFIQNLEGAIVRIENKTYGICRMTGNLIDKKRLMAVPHATLSMEAKVGNKKR
jgi:RNA polymerase-binding transcription factor DksA